MSELFLCSFASPDLYKSINRFVKQSKKIDFYKKVKVFGLNDLSRKKKNQIRSFEKKRLYGYACWKPEIILNFISELPENSILQYSDIGCHLNYGGRDRLNYYKNFTLKNDFLVFDYRYPDFNFRKKLNYQIYFEHEYTKEDLFKYFEIPKNSQIRSSKQVWSGTMFLKKNKRTIDFLKSWLEISNINNLIDDTDSIEKNDIKFIEHRHDQSIFSILCKINNIKGLSASECEWAEDENGRYWEHLKTFPILAKRDKEYNLIKRFLNRQTKNIRRIFK